jgi:colicin import membrane protein
MTAMKRIAIAALLSLAAVGAHAHDSASSGYDDKVHRRARPHIEWSGDTSGLETAIAVHCAPNGAVLSATVKRGSGNAQWDDAALLAVKRSDPMPLDVDGHAPANFVVLMRPAG